MGRIVKVALKGRMISAAGNPGGDPRPAVGIALERHIDEVIDLIGKKQGSFFTNPSGQLARSLWKHPFEMKGTLVTVRAGWGVKYGRVLEYGPRRKSWPIYPGAGPVAPGWPRAGQPTKFLRWGGPAGDRFSKGFTYVWKESSKRPHWKRAIDELAGPRRGKLRRAIKKAISDWMGGK